MILLNKVGRMTATVAAIVVDFAPVLELDLVEEAGHTRDYKAVEYARSVGLELAAGTAYLN
jgi:hypothetical protein